MVLSRPSLVFYVDVNAAEGDTVGCALNHATDPVQAQIFPPQPGDEVTILDEDGDRYFATVEVVDQDWIGLVVDWASCHPAGPKLTPYGSPATLFSIMPKAVTTAA